MLFDHFEKHQAEKIALKDAKHSVCYGDLINEVKRKSEKLEQVSVLAIALDNSVDWVLWDLAALYAKIPCVPIPPFFTEEQRNHAFASAGVSHVISDDGLIQIGKNQSNLLHDKTAKVTFTSGTTGTPKGVCLSQEAIENVAKSLVEVIGTEFVGIHLCTLPLAVLLENVAGVYAALIAGCTVHIPSLREFGDNYSNLNALTKNTQATSVILVSEILRLLLSQIHQDGASKNLKFVAVGGSKVDTSLITTARALGLPVYEGYGLSECGSVVSLNTPSHDKVGTVGQILPHIDVEISNNQIKIKQPPFLGYVGKKSEGLFNTGDIGQIDDDGFLSVSGRSKNVLITSYGRNIAPEWIEGIFLMQSSIAQIIVYGDAQPYLSALIVPFSCTVDIEETVKTVNNNLPDYAQIKEFQTVPPFTIEGGTLTGTGRPRREEILKQYTTKETQNEFLRSAC